MLIPAILVDVDGTVALRGDRGPYDWSRVGDDLPNQRVIDVARNLWRGGEREVVFVSGRDEVCRDETEDWLVRHIPWSLPPTLFMRPKGDNRNDAIIKREIYDREIAGTYDVFVVLDDRDRVVRMWREDLGLTCLQVAPGNF